MVETSPPTFDPIRPERAVVVPRARLQLDTFADTAGEALPVEQRIMSLLRRSQRGLVTLCGPPGSGKTTALRHLAAVLPPDAPVGLIDGVAGLLARSPVAGHSRARQELLVVVTPDTSKDSTCIARLQMVPWGEDDLIEYLLARHRPQCQAVMTRVNSSAAAPHFSLDGSPELCRMVLDTLAADPAIPDVPAALRRCLASVLSDPKMAAGALCLAALRNPDLGNASRVSRPLEPRVRRLVAFRPVQVALASELIVRDLCDGVNPTELEGILPLDLILETARLAAHWPAALDRLAALVASNKRRVHPMAASVLLAARPDWRPAPGAKVPTLTGAYVSGAHWAGVDLHGAEILGAHLDGAELDQADLRDARATSATLRKAKLRAALLTGLSAADCDLAGADLSSANAASADLVNADLHGADLRAAHLKKADLSGADLSAANLAGACFVKSRLDAVKLKGADLSGADLTGVVLKHLDLTDVSLAGANFHHARISDCDMEGIAVPGGNFHGAKLAGCYLTGSSMPGANFRDADLRNTGLADVDWEEVDLRDADLRGASFHLGSTRSGLVGSAVPCEGSKTGFYTDDFQDREFKDPEDIRKANLCGADLRGARVAGVDFYLVDLRRARYTEAQAEHFRRCGAIMGDP